MITPGSLAAPNDLLSCSKGDSADSILSVRFESQVALAPQAPALTLDGTSLSYGDLNARANRLAAYLRELGVGPESLVGIHFDRSFDLIVGIFAILKAGGAYLPLDLACPEDRLTFMLEDSRAKVVLTDSSLASRFAGYAGKIICLDQEAGRIASHSAENLPPITEPHHLAYVIYTSGSTGTPKGCLVTQANGRAALHLDGRVVSFWPAGCLDAFSLQRFRLFGLGNLRCAPLRRTARSRALHGQPFGFRFSRTAHPRAGSPC